MEGGKEEEQGRVREAVRGRRREREGGERGRERGERGGGRGEEGGRERIIK